jgi:putative SOS response-associated peptidase YedK
MCGRFTLTATQIYDVGKLLGAEVTAPQAAGCWKPRYNVAPSDPHWIWHGVGLSPAVWGFKPAWLREREGFINARAETVLEKPSFREAIRTRRCAVPVDGYYEWKSSPGGKRPFWFHRPDREIFLLAGLYEPGEGGAPSSFAIVTKGADSFMRPYHHRMPLCLAIEEAKAWLALAPEKVAAFLSDSPPGLALAAAEVSKRVNNPKHDDAECLSPAS